MNVARIRGFLLKLPKPALVRLQTDDGEPQELKPGKSYAKCAESIVALAPDLIECLDSDGKLIRAMRTDDAEARRSDAAAIPEALKDDPQALTLTHFANLLHRAYEHSTEVAFTRLVELVERMGDRADAIEARLERTEAANRQMLQQQVDDAFDQAAQVAARAAEEGGNGELGQQLIGAFLGGRMNAQAKANGTANGKGHG